MGFVVVVVAVVVVDCGGCIALGGISVERFKCRCVMSTGTSESRNSGVRLVMGTLSHGARLVMGKLYGWAWHADH